MKIFGHFTQNNEQNITSGDVFYTKQDAIKVNAVEKGWMPQEHTLDYKVWFHKPPIRFH